MAVNRDFQRLTAWKHCCNSHQRLLWSTSEDQLVQSTQVAGGPRSKAGENAWIWCCDLRRPGRLFFSAWIRQSKTLAVFFSFFSGTCAGIRLFLHSRNAFGVCIAFRKSEEQAPQ
jgi:hypothetical protein